MDDDDDASGGGGREVTNVNSENYSRAEPRESLHISTLCRLFLDYANKLSGCVVLGAPTCKQDGGWVAERK